jgi:7,8-dihydroneopterin aldolase/epimerase/oxygenase
MWTIAIKDARFFATHGIYAEEQVLGNELLVNLAISIADKRIDHLAETIDYAAVHGIISEQMKQQKPLLEQVAQNIATQLEVHFPEMLSLEISIQKLAPNFGTMVGASEIALRRSYAKP